MTYETTAELFTSYKAALVEGNAWDAANLRESLILACRQEVRGVRSRFIHTQKINGDLFNDARDDAIIEVLDNANAIRADGFIPYLKKAAFNKLEDQRRKLMRKKCFSGKPDTSLECLGVEDGHIDITEAPVEPLPSDVEVMRQKILRVLKRETPKNLRSLLDRIDGLEYHEIAEVEGVPIGTVKSRLHHTHHLFDRVQSLLNEIAEYKSGELKGITVLRDDIENLIAAKTECVGAMR